MKKLKVYLPDLAVDNWVLFKDKPVQIMGFGADLKRGRQIQYRRAQVYLFDLHGKGINRILTPRIEELEGIAFKPEMLTVLKFQHLKRRIYFNDELKIYCSFSLNFSKCKVNVKQNWYEIQALHQFQNIMRLNIGFDMVGGSFFEEFYLK